jgi:hypothetical protein
MHVAGTLHVRTTILAACFTHALNAAQRCTDLYFSQLALFLSATPGPR